MITEAPIVQESFSKADLGGVPHLLVFRQAPYRFSLLGAENSIRSPFKVYINDVYTNQGSIDLINHIMALALAETEQWSADQLAEASQANTIFILYNSYDNILLNQSNLTLSNEDLQEMYPESIEIFSTNDVSDDGMTSMVTQLLTYMQT